MEFSEPPSSSALTEFHDAMEDSIESHLSDHPSPEADEPDSSLSDCSMQLLPPSTTKIYRTLEALIYAVNKHASRQGHGIVKSGQKKKNSNGG